ncbi:MAG: 50S ribosome-binding GTPase [Planctomycetes bacterium]|nr:50S ribosome-binding GTPase [Planctomycetota bacterium]
MPIIVGLCGGGNSGKSTIFNALAGFQASPVSSLMGLTRRALLAIPSALLEKQKDLLDRLFERFGNVQELLPDGEEGEKLKLLPDGKEGEALMKKPGPPYYIKTDVGLPEAILVDMPDMDAAGKGIGFANRGNATKVLSACDCLVLLTTNRTFNAGGHVTFFRPIVSEDGFLRVVLIYRCYNPKNKLDHIQKVFRKVEGNLFPGTDRPPVLARLIALDDSKIRKDGGKPKLIQEEKIGENNTESMKDGVEPLRSVLTGVDRASLCRDDTAAVIKRIQDIARDICTDLEKEQVALKGFRDALRKATQYRASDSMSDFPIAEFERLASEIWIDELELDSVRKAIYEATRVLRPLVLAKTTHVPPIEPFFGNADRLLNDLQNKCVMEPKDWNDAMVNGCKPKFEKIDMPKTLDACLGKIKADNYFEKIKACLNAAWEAAATLPPNPPIILRPIIRTARENMTFWEKLQEYCLNVGTLVIPVRKQWLKEKTQILEAALKKTVSGEFLEKCDSLLSDAKQRKDDVKNAITEVERAFENWKGEGSDIKPA